MKFTLRYISKQKFIVGSAHYLSNARLTFFRPSSLIFLIVTLHLFFITPLSAQRKNELLFYYRLQSVKLIKANRVRLFQFLRKQSLGSYFLIQSFACDTGGFSNSLEVANLRAIYIREIMQKQGLPVNYMGTATGVVLLGEPRTSHRRSRIQVFNTQSQWEQAYQSAQKEARKANLKAQQAWKKPRQQREEPPLAQHNVRQELIFVLFLLLFLVGLRYSSDLFFFLKKSRHKFSIRQARLLESSTQGKVKPLIAYDSLPPLRSVKTFLENTARNHNMEKNQRHAKKNKSKAIAIPGTVDPHFAGKSLKELCKAPVHALVGLTPRHTRLLDEAFGVRTVEDLAKLKYVEIAKAIAILARYE